MSDGNGQDEAVASAEPHGSAFNSGTTLISPETRAACRQSSVSYPTIKSCIDVIMPYI
jgi:hypothetical protein